MTKLLPKYSPILITLINGIYDASMAMVSIPVKLYESGFSYASVISIYFGSAVFFLLRIVFEMKDIKRIDLKTSDSLPVFYRSLSLEELFENSFKINFSTSNEKSARRYRAIFFAQKYTCCENVFFQLKHG